MKTLSQMLQGAVLTQVNGGLEDVLNAFLGENSSWAKVCMNPH